MAVDSSLAEMHWKHDLLGSIEVGIVVLDKAFNVQVWNQFMENHSSIVPGMIQNKNLFEFFPEIDEEWFTRKAAPAFSLKSPVFIIWEQRPYYFILIVVAQLLLKLNTCSKILRFFRWHL